MPSLARFLQHEFQRYCPEGWLCYSERRFLSSHWEKLLGYSPRADVLMVREDGHRRLWIEFEVSRADPVANHAKFATSHLFEAQSVGDSFISMVSAHVTPGRHNLAANAIHLLRNAGLSAFQTHLLPMQSSTEIQELNYTEPVHLDDANLDILAEIQRAMLVAEPVFTIFGNRIHFVGNIMEALLNLNQWNADMENSTARALWGRRTVTYFVYDPRTHQFAPSKFCAYISLSEQGAPIRSLDVGMTVQKYVTIESETPRFDGQVAWKHLIRNLGMAFTNLYQQPRINQHFSAWMLDHQKSITVHPSGPQVLVPPAWFWR